MRDPKGHERHNLTCTLQVIKKGKYIDILWKNTTAIVVFYQCPLTGNLNFGSKAYAHTYTHTHINMLQMPTPLPCFVSCPS